MLCMPSLLAALNAEPAAQKLKRFGSIGGHPYLSMAASASGRNFTNANAALCGGDGVLIDRP